MPVYQTTGTVYAQFIRLLSRGSVGEGVVFTVQFLLHSFGDSPHSFLLNLTTFDKDFLLQFISLHYFYLMWLPLGRNTQSGYITPGARKLEAVGLTVNWKNGLVHLTPRS